MRIYDLSASISASMPTYPGDPGVRFEQWAALDKGDAANVTMLHFGAHAGTHVDAPAHFIAGTPRVESLSLETLIGRARVIEIPRAGARPQSRARPAESLSRAHGRLRFRARAIRRAASRR